MQRDFFLKLMKKNFWGVRMGGEGGVKTWVQEPPNGCDGDEAPNIPIKFDHSDLIRKN